MIPSNTLAAPAEYLLEVKRSRFLARAAAVESAAQALAWLEVVRVADATHNCWAWRIGEDYRSGDDDEPAGTAGRPILAAIDGQRCDRVAVSVARWFGGIKLGAGGLVRAYGGAAAQCLRGADKQPLIPLARVRLLAPFAELGAVHALLVLHQAVKYAETFVSDGAWMELELPASELPALRARLRDATRNRVQINDNGNDEDI